MTRPDNYAALRKKRIKHMRPAAKQALQDIEKQSRDAWLDQILEEIALNYEHKDHDDSCLAAQAWREAKAAIKQWIADEIIGEDGHPAGSANILRTQQRKKLELLTRKEGQI